MHGHGVYHPGGAVAPGLMAFGLFVWADAWTHSPLALNAFKCALGSSLFGLVVLISYRRPMPERAVLWLRGPPDQMHPSLLQPTEGAAGMHAAFLMGAGM